MNKRSGKFYRKNEREVMQALGLKPTLNSGSGWIEKEDGQSEDVICQLKSTDAQSIRIIQKDLKVLEENAAVTKKIPVFAIQFLNTGEVWIMTKPQYLKGLDELLETGETTQSKLQMLDLDKMQDAAYERLEQCNKKIIQSSSEAKQKAQNEIELQRIKRSKEWKERLRLR